MNLRILIWVLAIVAFLLCLADAHLIFNDMKLRLTLKNTIDLQTKAFTESAALNRLRIRQEMSERFGQELNRFADTMKKLQAEKKITEELEKALKEKDKE